MFRKLVQEAISFASLVRRIMESLLKDVIVKHLETESLGENFEFALTVCENGDKDSASDQIQKSHISPARSQVLVFLPLAGGVIRFTSTTGVNLIQIHLHTFTYY